MDGLKIPGFGTIEAEHLILDFNGTLAEDGKLMDGVAAQIERLAGTLNVVVVTADTFGRAEKELEGLTCTVKILPPGPEDEAKLAVVREFGEDSCIAMGNGANDTLMLKAARLGIAIMGKEGVARIAAQAADVIVTSPIDALDLILRPMRLKATLRR